MHSIGLTGGFGTGKSTVAAMFVRLGAQAIDADKIVRDLTQPHGRCFRRIIKTFGQDILRKNAIDRKRLADTVFQSAVKRRHLEKIIHPEVRKEIKKRIRSYRKNKRCCAVIVEIPLLFETGMYKDFDRTVVVTAPRNIQVQRVCKRTGLSKAHILRRIRSQWSLSRKVKLADYVIRNGGSMQKTKKQVQETWSHILKIK